MGTIQVIMIKELSDNLLLTNLFIKVQSFLAQEYRINFKNGLYTKLEDKKMANVLYNLLYNV